MKAILFFFLLIGYQQLGISQIVLSLWPEDRSLEKENLIWIEKTTRYTRTLDGLVVESFHSKTEIESGKRRKMTLYDSLGKIKEVDYLDISDSDTQILEFEEGDREIKEYNERGKLILEAWEYPNGMRDEKRFFYEEDHLVKIVEKDEFGVSSEQWKYREGKLVKILSLNEFGEVTMERRNIYDSGGKIKEKQRIQNGKINMRIRYFYDDQQRLYAKEEEKINRLLGSNMPPEVYEYRYHTNGTVREEKWIIYEDESKEVKKTELITTYNDRGLEVKTQYFIYAEKEVEVTHYEYKFQ